MNKKQKEFILLRADGLSFDKIATKLKTSKPTLIQWSKLFEDKIEQIQFEAFVEIKEAFSWNTKKRYETLLKQLDKIDKGIIGADLTKALASLGLKRNASTFSESSVRLLSGE